MWPFLIVVDVKRDYLTSLIVLERVLSLDDLASLIVLERVLGLRDFPALVELLLFFLALLELPGHSLTTLTPAVGKYQYEAE